MEENREEQMAETTSPDPTSESRETPGPLPLDDSSEYSDTRDSFSAELAPLTESDMEDLGSFSVGSESEVESHPSDFEITIENIPGTSASLRTGEMTKSEVSAEIQKIYNEERSRRSKTETKSDNSKLELQKEKESHEINVDISTVQNPGRESPLVQAIVNESPIEVLLRCLTPTDEDSSETRPSASKNETPDSSRYKLSLKKFSDLYEHTHKQDKLVVKSKIENIVSRRLKSDGEVDYKLDPDNLVTTPTSRERIVKSAPPSCTINTLIPFLSKLELKAEIQDQKQCCEKTNSCESSAVANIPANSLEPLIPKDLGDGDIPLLLAFLELSNCPRTGSSEPNSDSKSEKPKLFASSRKRPADFNLGPRKHVYFYSPDKPSGTLLKCRTQSLPEINAVPKKNIKLFSANFDEEIKKIVKTLSFENIKPEKSPESLPTVFLTNEREIASCSDASSELETNSEHTLDQNKTNESSATNTESSKPRSKTCRKLIYVSEPSECTNSNPTFQECTYTDAVKIVSRSIKPECSKVSPTKQSKIVSTSPVKVSVEDPDERFEKRSSIESKWKIKLNVCEEITEDPQETKMPKDQPSTSKAHKIEENKTNFSTEEESGTTHGAPQTMPIIELPDDNERRKVKSPVKRSMQSCTIEDITDGATEAKRLKSSVIEDITDGATEAKRLKNSQN